MFLSIAVGGCALDLWTKHWIFERLSVPWVEGGGYSPPIWLWPSIFGFETSLNEGAVFGVGQGKVLLFASLSVVAAVGIVLWLFVGSGGSGSAPDDCLGVCHGGHFGQSVRPTRAARAHLGVGVTGHEVGEPVYAVRDWMHFQIPAIGFDWPNFNLADSCLVCGAILLVWHAFRRPD